MKDLIKKLSEGSKLILLRGTVTSVYKQKQLIDVLPFDSNAQIHNVKLKAVEDSVAEGIIVFPASGSEVIIALVDNENMDAFVVAQTAFESVLIAIKNAFKLEVDSAGNLVINDGTNGEIIKLPDLIVEIEKLNSFLSAIKSTFSSFVPIPNDGGAALKAAMNTALSGEQTADLSEVGNSKIKH